MVLIEDVGWSNRIEGVVLTARSKCGPERIECVVLRE